MIDHKINDINLQLRGNFPEVSKIQSPLEEIKVEIARDDEKMDEESCLAS